MDSLNVCRLEEFIGTIKKRSLKAIASHRIFDDPRGNFQQIQPSKYLQF